MSGGKEQAVLWKRFPFELDGEGFDIPDFLSIIGNGSVRGKLTHSGTVEDKIGRAHV